MVPIIKPIKENRSKCRFGSETYVCFSNYTFWRLQNFFYFFFHEENKFTQLRNINIFFESISRVAATLLKMRGLALSLMTMSLTAVVVFNAYYQKKQFYPSVVYITKSNPCMAVSMQIPNCFPCDRRWIYFSATA